MARAPKDPFSVPDPLGPAWDDQEARQRRYNEAQAAAAERKYQQARRIERAADAGGKTLDAAQVGTATHAYISRNPTAERLARRVSRRAGPAGTVLSGIESTAGYVADRGQGMPGDEALVRNGGRFALGLAGGRLGTVGGAGVGTIVEPGLGTLVGGVIGGVVGGSAGESWADEAGDAYLRGKKAVSRGMAAVQQAAQPFTDPRYVMRALRSR